MSAKTNTQKPAAPAAAKPAEKPAAKPALDFSSLTAETVTEPLKQKRTQKVERTPFVAWLKETHENGNAKAVTVPADAVADVVYLIRAAADVLGLGSRIVKDENPDGTVTVKFQGRQRRAYVKRSGN